MTQFEILAGIDWSAQTRKVAVVDADGELLGEREFAHSGDGLAEMADWILGHSPDGKAAVKAGKSVYRTTLAELAGSLAKAERQGQFAEKIRFFARAALLIVDKIGCVPITRSGTSLFFQIVNARNEKGAMILASNRSFAEWGDIFFGATVVATAVLDRLLHHATVIRIKGASYRLRGHADLIPEHVRANAPITPPKN